MTKVESSNLAQLLQAVLRGAAGPWAAASNHLVLFNGEVEEDPGSTSASWPTPVPVISTIERLLGAQFDDCSWPMEKREGSLADRCWREAVRCAETKSLKELVGGTLAL